MRRRRSAANVDTPPADRDSVDATVDTGSDEPAQTATEPASRVGWRRVLVYGVLPAGALLLAMAAGYFKWQYSSVEESRTAAAESLQAAKDSTVVLLSYQPASVESELTAARDRTTGTFRDAYTHLTNDVVIPGAKQKLIATTATIPAAVSVSADANHAVALVFVSQTMTIGAGKPSESMSSVRVSLDKVGDRWLISGFDPV
jgi:Mce-associated membrane protein